MSTPMIEKRKDLAPLERQVRVPETVPEFLEVTRPRGRRRRMALTLVLTGGVAAAIALAIVRPWETSEIAYTGDWKDSLAEETVPYSGDWKDSLAEETVPYSGDWKDTVVAE